MVDWQFIAYDEKEFPRLPVLKGKEWLSFSKNITKLPYEMRAYIFDMYVQDYPVRRFNFKILTAKINKKCC